MTELSSAEELAEQARAASTWGDYEDGLLALAIRLYDGLPPDRREVGTFAFKAALWNLPPEQPPSNDQLSSLFDAVASLHANAA